MLLRLNLFLKFLFAFLALFALLVSNRAGSLACRLARGLALATTTSNCGSRNVLGFYSLNSFHFVILQKDFILSKDILAQIFIDVNTKYINYIYVLFGF